MKINVIYKHTDQKSKKNRSKNRSKNRKPVKFDYLTLFICPQKCRQWITVVVFL